MFITSFCPTRGRPNQCEIMLNSWVKNTNNSKIAIYVQNDDPYISKYKKLSKKFQQPNIIWHFDKRWSTGMMWNMLYENYSTTNIIHLASDDNEYKTKNWDLEVFEFTKRYPDEIYCIAVSEGTDDSSKACRHPIISKKMADELGYFFPLMFDHYEVDLWWRNICRMNNRFFRLNNIIVAHQRPNANLEYDWREEFKSDSKSKNLKNDIFKKDKYKMRRLKRLLENDAAHLARLIK